MDKKESNNSQLIIYQTETGETKIDVRFQDETVWLSQQLIAELFQTTKQNISLHIANIYEDKELLPQATVKEFLTVQKEGNRQVTRNLEYYNLDMIISVGYRIKSRVATHFRQWATRHLREFIVKGFVLDDERLKNPNQPFDYFDELARRIPMYMKDWIKKLHGFLQLNERGILTHAGKISHQLALEKAESEYEQYAHNRQLATDKKGNAFDVLVNEAKMIEDKSKKKRKK